MSEKIKIWHWGRDGRTCHVVYQESGGAMRTRDFPASTADEAIMAELAGRPRPASGTPPAPPSEAAPASPTGKKPRRSQMIAALDAAGIRDYDRSRLQDVKTAYEKAVETGKVKLP